jgi:hypothetical protein
MFLDLPSRQDELSDSQSEPAQDQGQDGYDLRKTICHQDLLDDAKYSSNIPEGGGLRLRLQLRPATDPAQQVSPDRLSMMHSEAIQATSMEPRSYMA